VSTIHWVEARPRSARRHSESGLPLPRRVVGRMGTRPRHARVRDTGDPLHAVRATEGTSLWRLAAV
jgi:hypothetical protein